MKRWKIATAIVLSVSFSWNWLAPQRAEIANAQTEKAPPEKGATILYKDGTVKEGIFVREEKVSKRESNYVFKDENGEEFTAFCKDVAKVLWKPTTWQIRAQNLLKYEEKLKKAQDTVLAQRTLAKWCKDNTLPDKALEHYQKSLALEEAELLAKAEEKSKGDAKRKREMLDAGYLKMAAWCEKTDLLEEQDALIAKAVENQKSALDLGKAEDCNAMAAWGRKNKMLDVARDYFQKALAIEPANKTALAGMKQIDASTEFIEQSVIKWFKKKGRAWKISVAFQDDVTLEKLQEWEQKIRELSMYIFQITEGQFFIHECRIEDKTSDGLIIVEAGKAEWKGLDNEQGVGVLAYCQGMGKGDHGYQIHAAGRNWVSVLCHEMFHGAMQLKDEYFQDPQCHCVMRSAPNPQALCNETNHLGGGAQFIPCWKQVKNLWGKEILQPNPDWIVQGDDRNLGTLSIQGLMLSEPPSMKITIEDNQ